MIWPHNAAEPDHTTGLQIPLWAYLHLLSAKKIELSGGFTYHPQGVDDEHRANFSGLMTRIGLVRDFHKRPVYSGVTSKPYKLWNYLGDRDFLTGFNATSKKIEYEDQIGYSCDVVWSGDDLTVPSAWGDIAHASSDFSLPMGGGNRDTTEGGFFAGLNYADLTSIVTVEVGPSVRSWDEPWFVDEATNMNRVIGSAEEREDTQDGLNEFSEVTIAKFVIGSVEYPVTARIGQNIYSAFISSDLKLTAKWT